jgi:hypothetical protein
MASELFVDQIKPGPGNNSIELNASGSISFKTNGNTQLTIDSAGRLLTPNRPYFYARAANADHTSGTIPYNLVDHNVGGHYDSSTYTFTAPIAGIYSFTFQFFSKNNGAAGGADLMVNGVLTIRCGREGTETYYEGYSNAINKYLNVGDTVNVMRYTGTVHTNDPFSHFSGYFVG